VEKSRNFGDQPRPRDTHLSGRADRKEPARDVFPDARAGLGVIMTAVINTRDVGP
jgi:hypothetical protein